jgi:hypothetical protein
MSSLPSGTVTFLFTDIEGSTRLAREGRGTQNPRRDMRQNVRHVLL